jgi:hypothetical protein
MGVGSGLGGSIGHVAESTYGTYVAPTRFLEIDKADLKKQKKTVQGGGLAAGRLVPLGSRRVVTTKAGGGSVSLEVPNKGLGLFLASTFGGAPAPVQQAATAAYLQTHPLADNVGRFLTIQSGIPTTDGTVRPYSFLGCKFMSVEFACGIDELLMMTCDVDARDVSEAQTLAAPSFTTGVVPHHFGEMAVKLGTYGAEVAVSGVRKVQVKIDRPQKDDRFYAGQAGLKGEPLVNANVKVSGTIEADYLDKTVFADRFAADSSIALVWEFIGANIASTYYETFRLKLPMIFFDGDSPVLDGPDVVSGTFPFTGLFDGTNAAVICEYMSIDTAL